MQMELANLAAFVAVAEHGGFSAAAEQLHLTQPAVSKRIAQTAISGRPSPLVALGTTRKNPVFPYMLSISHELACPSNDVAACLRIYLCVYRISTAYHIRQRNKYVENVYKTPDNRSVLKS